MTVALPLLDAEHERGFALDLNGTHQLSSKVGWYRDRVEAWSRGEKVAPITIDCSMTRKCQASCHFCFATTQASENDVSGEITKEKFFQFLEDAAEIGVKGVAFISDGESTVVPWYAEAVEHAARVGLAVGAGSNGILLRRDVLERVLPHLSYLRFNFSAGERKRWAEIMGLKQHLFDVVVQNIRDGMDIIHHGRECANCRGTGDIGPKLIEEGADPWQIGDMNMGCDECKGTGRIPLKCSLNMQMVLHPKDGDQVIPFAERVCELKPVYAIIKHCSDSDERAFGVDYSKYEGLTENLKEAERLGREAGVRIAVKWDKIQTGWNRQYTSCHGPNFMMQISGNGTVAPCGMKFNEKHKALHIGSIARTRFRDLFHSKRWDEVMSYIGGEHFNPQCRCGSLCLQHETNNWLHEYVNGRVGFPEGTLPPDLEFI